MDQRIKTVLGNGFKRKSVFAIFAFLFYLWVIKLVLPSFPELINLILVDSVQRLSLMLAPSFLVIGVSLQLIAYVKKWKVSKPCLIPIYKQPFFTSRKSESNNMLVLSYFPFRPVVFYWGNKLNEEQIEATLAHEKAHIAGYDTLWNMTILILLMPGAYLVFIWLAYASHYLQGHTTDGVWLLKVFWDIIFIVVFCPIFFNQYRQQNEYQADLVAALSVGKEKYLEAFNIICSHLSEKSKKGNLIEKVYASHPTYYQRVERLHKLIP